MSLEMSNLPSKKNISKKGKKAVKKVVKAVEKKNLSGSNKSTVSTINATAKMASKIMGAGYQFAGLKQSKGKMRDRLSNWLEALASPFTSDPQKCPVNFNPMPTLQTTTMRTTWTSKVGLPAANNYQVCLFPGHTLLVDADEMDGPSYHQCWQIVGPNYFPIGPMQYADSSSVLRFPINGVASTITNVAGGGGGTVGPNSVCLDSSVVSTTYSTQPLYYDTQVPFTGSAKNGYHTRYKLTAMEVRFSNETPEIDRGGNFYTVQPLNTVGFDSINKYALYPTFYDHGICDEKEGRVSWIPRIQDLSFYHPGAQNVAATNSVNTAGIMLWFVNTTGKLQTLSFEAVFHWEVGGQNLQTLSTSAVQMPSDNNIVSPTLSYLQQGAHTATPAPRVAEVVGVAQSPWRDTINEGAKAVGKLVSEHAADLIKSHVGGKIGIQLAGHMAGLF